MRRKLKQWETYKGRFERPMHTIAVLAPLGANNMAKTAMFSLATLRLNV